MITNNPDNIEERLEAHKADLNAIEISSQAATAFTARSNQIKYPIPNNPASTSIPTSNININSSPKDIPSRLFYYYNNCGQQGHYVMHCFTPGGGLAGQVPWGKKIIDDQSPTLYQNYPRGVLPFPVPPTNSKNTQNKPHVPQPTKQDKNIAMMAPEENIIKISSNPSVLPVICDKKCLWLINSAASSHICGNHNLFLKKTSSST